MRVPPVLGGYCFGMKNFPKNKSNKTHPIENSCDTVSFSSISKYLKKYNTLPDEIKKVLSPKDAVDMFKDMEMVAEGIVKRKNVGLGNSSKVFLNPWLDDYYLLVLKDTKTPTKVIYSKTPLGDAVWGDKDNMNIQIIKKAI